MILAGVWSLTNTAWEQVTPITVRISPPTAPARTAIHTDSFISFSFFAPKSCEITIPAPTATPVNRLIRQVTRILLAPTAAAAFLPSTFPTKSISTVLYNCWNRLPRNSGIANSTNPFPILPCVRSLVFILTYSPNSNSLWLSTGCSLSSVTIQLLLLIFITLI